MSLCSIFLQCFRYHRALHSFPTRRSSDLAERRTILTKEKTVVPRISDIYAALPAITGKLELEYEGELQGPERSEEHTSELQSHSDLVCRLLLEKKNYYMSSSL